MLPLDQSQKMPTDLLSRKARDEPITVIYGAVQETMKREI